MSTACVSLAHKAADEIRIEIFFRLFGMKINELLVRGNKLRVSRAGCALRTHGWTRWASALLQTV